MQIQNKNCHKLKEVLHIWQQQNISLCLQFLLNFVKLSDPQRAEAPSSNTHTQRNSNPHPPHPMHIIYEWEWCLSLSSCSLGMCRTYRFKMGTQMALKAQCSTQPLKWALWQLVSLWLLMCLLDWINSGCGGKGLWLAYTTMSRVKQQQSRNSHFCFCQSEKSEA